ncbi:hypothetical protein GCM10029976_031220 [Kribbella albertanoniae]
MPIDEQQRGAPRDILRAAQCPEQHRTVTTDHQRKLPGAHTLPYGAAHGSGHHGKRRLRHQAAPRIALRPRTPHVQIPTINSPKPPNQPGPPQRSRRPGTTASAARRIERHPNNLEHDVSTAFPRATHQPGPRHPEDDLSDTHMPSINS